MAAAGDDDDEPGDDEASDEVVVVSLLFLSVISSNFTFFGLKSVLSKEKAAWEGGRERVTKGRAERSEVCEAAARETRRDACRMDIVVTKEKVGVGKMVRGLGFQTL